MRTLGLSDVRIVPDVDRMLVGSTSGFQQTKTLHFVRKLCMCLLCIRWNAFCLQGGKKKPLKAPKKEGLVFEDDKEFKIKQAQARK